MPDGSLVLMWKDWLTGATGAGVLPGHTCGLLDDDAVLGDMEW